MRYLKLAGLGIACLTVVGLAAVRPVEAQWPPWKGQANGDGPSLEQVARTLDRVEDSILDDGVVVIKQPDVWGQARMTKYRREFEQIFQFTMLKDAYNFDQKLQAVIARSDQAAFESQSALAAVLTPLPPTNGRRTPVTTTTDDLNDNLNAMTTNVFNSAGLPGFQNKDGEEVGSAGKFKPPFAEDGLLGSVLGEKKVLGSDAVALEPSIKLDELKRYLDHGNELRRTNLGDDTADSAGYGLYLVRMPVSIQPGEITNSGHGALVRATLYHDFAPDYLHTTFRNLVVNDLVDQLGPAVYEVLRSGVREKLADAKSVLTKAESDLDTQIVMLKQRESTVPDEIAQSLSKDLNRACGVARQLVVQLTQDTNKARQEKEAKKEQILAKAEEKLKLYPKGNQAEPDREQSVIDLITALADAKKDVRDGDGVMGIVGTTSELLKRADLKRAVTKSAPDVTEDMKYEHVQTYDRVAADFADLDRTTLNAINEAAVNATEMLLEIQGDIEQQFNLTITTDTVIGDHTTTERQPIDRLLSPSELSVLDSSPELKKFREAYDSLDKKCGLADIEYKKFITALCQKRFAIDERF